MRGPERGSARLALLAALAAAVAVAETRSAGVQEFANPQPVAIAGYSGDAMEPFLSRDGRWLFFNDSNAPGEDADLHMAERVDELAFVYRGELPGANSPELDAVASLAASGRFCFVSLRSYAETLASLHCGNLVSGEVVGIELVAGVSLGLPGWVNFDAEIAWDGGELYFVDGEVSGVPPPTSADLVVARAVPGGFERRPESAAWFSAINSTDLEYAPAITADRLELFFTRYREGDGARLFRSLREGIEAPFGEPVELEALVGFVEAPALGPDGLELFFHRLDAGTFRIFRATRPERPILFADSFEAGFARWSGGAGWSRD